MTYRFESALFLPDTILPVQYYPTGYNRAQFSGEMRLLWAVLEEAYCCVAGAMTARSGLRMAPYREACVAHTWFMLSDPAGGPFTFANICAVFGLAESRLRAHADTQFQQLTPPKKMGWRPDADIRVSAVVRVSKLRRAQRLPAYRPFIEIRRPRHRMVRRAVRDYQATEALARQQAQVYIASNAWRYLLKPGLGQEEGDHHDQARVYHSSLSVF